MPMWVVAFAPLE